MKRIIMGVAAVAAMAMAQANAMSLADASAKVLDAANDAAAMSDVMKQLAPADQAAFLAKVNAAIASFPGSDAEKGAKYLNAAKAALASADKTSLASVLAEVFATVPLEYLTVINERLAEDTFSRDADPANPITDDEMRQVSLDTMKIIKERNAGNDSESVRDAFAILMFIRASKGTPAELRDQLIETLPTQEARDMAKNDWFPAALGEGRDKSYEPMLAVANDVKMPDMEEIAVIAGMINDPAVPGSMLNDLAAAVNSSGRSGTPFSKIGTTVVTDSMPLDFTDHDLSRIPKTDGTLPAYPGYRRGGGSKGSDTAVDSNKEDGHQNTYKYQTTF